MQGAVANFVESEQLIVLEDKEGNFTTSSFVQIRGSIPLLWSQIPNIKYKPPTRIAPPSAYQVAFDRHFKSLIDQYQVSITFSVCMCTRQCEAAFGSCLIVLLCHIALMASDFAMSILILPC